MSLINILRKQPTVILPNQLPNSRTKVCIVTKNHQGQFLLLKRGVGDTYPNIWECPGGKREGGELIEETVIRELLEETGIQIKQDDLQYLFASTFFEEATKQNVYVFYYLVKTDTDPTSTPEHIQWEWFEKGEALELVPFEGPKLAILES